jgi:hypothetical protein
MTPERWHQIDALFDAALRVDPFDRETWLRDACGDDDDMMVRLRGLLKEDERAEAVGFLEPSEVPHDPTDQTATWQSNPVPESVGEPFPDFLDGESDDEPDGFERVAAIADETGPQPVGESPTLVQARLRELPVLYVPKSWRRAVVVLLLLAVLPFATLLLLAWQHTDAMGWLWRGWRKSETARIWLFSLDAMILLVVAAGAAFGARTISRLRR